MCFPSLFDIYKRSVINVPEFYKNCFFLSYKTANSQEVINKLPYYQYANMLAYLDEIIAIENGKKPGENSNDDPMNTAREMQEDMMGRAKSMTRGFTPPKMGNMKFPSFDKLKF